MLMFLLSGPLVLATVVLACGILGSGGFRGMVNKYGIWHALVCSCHGYLVSMPLTMLLSAVLSCFVLLPGLSVLYQLVFVSGIEVSMCLFILCSVLYAITFGCVCTISLYHSCTNSKPVLSVLEEMDNRSGLFIDHSSAEAKSRVGDLGAKGFKFLAVNIVPMRILALSPSEYSAFAGFLRVRQLEFSLPFTRVDYLVGYLLAAKSVCVEGSGDILYTFESEDGRDIGSILTSEMKYLNPREVSSFMSMMSPLKLCVCVGWFSSWFVMFSLMCPGSGVSMIMWVLGPIVSCAFSWWVWAILEEVCVAWLVKLDQLVSGYKTSGKMGKWRSWHKSS